MPGEFDFISWIRSQQSASKSVLLPAGDDLAILKWSPDDLLLVGVDQVLDGVHFDSSVHAPRAIGRKAMNRNLSDCAAMAALPAAALVSIAAPHGIGQEYLQELYLGIKEAGDKFNCPIIGGDTASWPNKLAATVTILARSAGVTPVTRSGAKPGDVIYVTGPLGGSILGRHMTFEPKIELARRLAQTYPITSMIDLSDGLSRDLQQICRESNVSALLNLVPVHEEIEMRRDGHSPLEHALHDGEDYELLFTSPDLIPTDLAIRIGQIGLEPPAISRTVPRVWIQGPSGQSVPLEPKAWEHPL